MAPSQKAADLAAEARYAANRVTLYQQRVYSGRADGRRLAELQRIAAGAADRAADQGSAAASPAAGVSLDEALADVATQLDGANLDRDARNRLLHRQAQLGDLRDEVALRVRREAGELRPGSAGR
jgi:hypothetical protein